MEIKDYLHLYIGCEVRVNFGDYTEIRIIDQTFLYTFFDEDIGEYMNDPKLILKKLSDITEKEKRYLKDGKLSFTPETTRQLLIEGYDLFNLIDSGLAIDKTSLKN